MSAIVSTAGNQADGLRIEVDRLNNYIYPTDRDGYLLAIWLTNAVSKIEGIRPADAAFFRGWADTVAAIPAPPPVTEKTTADLIPALQAVGLTNQKVFDAAQSLRAAMPGMNRRATNLMVAKRLHDALHNVQLYIVPLWTRSVASLAGNPSLAGATAADRQRALRNTGRSLQGEFGFLPDAEPLRALAQKTADDLVAVAAAADVALAANDIERLTSSIASVRSIVKEGMHIYANRMDMYQEALDLSDVLADLRDLAGASQDATLQVNANRLASSLAAIVQDIDVLGPQHSRWQLLDLRLAALENWFDFLHLGPSVYSSFNLEWTSVDAAVDSLAREQPADRFDRIMATRGDFLAACQVPIQVAPSDQAIVEFGDFVIEVRSVFHEVDLRMKQTCNQLREITNQLAQL